MKERRAMSESGEIGFLDGARERVACEIAGALAESGVEELTVQDPRVCMARRVRARECDLPREIVSAEPGTTFSGEGVGILVDVGGLKWVADEVIASRLRAITVA